MVRPRRPSGEASPRHATHAPGGGWLGRATSRALARRLSRIAPRGPVLVVGGPHRELVGALRAFRREVTYLQSLADGKAPSEELARARGGWAAILFFDSLERLSDPGASLVNASRMLVPGGVLAVAGVDAGGVLDETPADDATAAWTESGRANPSPNAVVEALAGLDLSVDLLRHPGGWRIVSGWMHGLLDPVPGRPDLREVASLAVLGALADRRGHVYAEAHRD